MAINDLNIEYIMIFSKKIISLNSFPCETATQNLKACKANVETADSKYTGWVNNKTSKALNNYFS